MAGTTKAVVRTTHAFTTTSGAGNADTITFSASPAPSFLFIYNNDATTPLYMRYDGTAPVIGADETYIIRPASGKSFTFPKQSGIGAIKVISTSAISIDVETQ